MDGICGPIHSLVLWTCDTTTTSGSGVKDFWIACWRSAKNPYANQKSWHCSLQFQLNTAYPMVKCFTSETQYAMFKRKWNLNWPINTIPGIVSTLVCFRRREMHENSWSMSSCVWPTGRHPIFTCKYAPTHLIDYLYRLLFLHFPTFRNMLSWTRSAANVSVYLFLLSRQVLSICR